MADWCQVGDLSVVRTTAKSGKGFLTLAAICAPACSGVPRNRSASGRVAFDSRTTRGGFLPDDSLRGELQVAIKLAGPWRAKPRR